MRRRTRELFGEDDMVIWNCEILQLEAMMVYDS